MVENRAAQIMDKDSIAKITRVARERGYSWSQIAAYFGISRERAMQISGFKIGKDIKKLVLERAAGHCELCKNESNKLYVARIDNAQEQTTKTCLALDRACFYEQNTSDRANGIANQKERHNRDVEVCFPEIARNLGIDIVPSGGDVDVVDEASGEETPPPALEAPQDSVPEDGGGTRSDTGIGSIGT